MDDPGVPGWQIGDPSPSHEFVPGVTNAEQCSFMLRRFQPGPDKGIICGGPKGDPVHQTEARRPVDEIRADVERLLGAVSVPACGFALRQGQGSMTAADRDGLLVRFVVTWLLENGLVSVAAPEAFDEWFTMDLGEPFAGDIAAKVQEAVARLARFDALAAQMRDGR